MEDLKKITEDLDMVRARLNMFTAQENPELSEDEWAVADYALAHVTDILNELRMVADQKDKPNTGDPNGQVWGEDPNDTKENSL